MIVEALTWAFSRATPGARKAGLIKEVAAIAGKYSRNKKAWQDHLDQTRNLITNAIQMADPAEPILVLGAGLGLDLPFDALNNHPSGALLCDAVKTPQLSLKLRKYKNIEFELYDVTGLLDLYWDEVSCTSIAPPPFAPLPLTGYSMAISVNMLSQLPLSFPPDESGEENNTRLTTAIQQAHIMTLKAMDYTILLITDYERCETLGTDTEVVTTVAQELWPCAPMRKWDWLIAPKGELAGGQSTMLKVGAWQILK